MSDFITPSNSVSTPFNCETAVRSLINPRSVARNRIRLCNSFLGAWPRRRMELLISYASILVPLTRHTTGLDAAILHVSTAPMEVLTNIDNYVGFVLAERIVVNNGTRGPNALPA